MSTQTTLPRRILSMTLCALRKTLATAVVSVALGTMGFAVIMVGVSISVLISDMGLLKTAQSFVLAMAGTVATCVVVMWAFYELFGDKELFGGK